MSWFLPDKSLLARMTLGATRTIKLDVETGPDELLRTEARRKAAKRRYYANLLERRVYAREWARKKTKKR